MNWMIDGAYGDDYRKAMGYKAQVPAVDEWELERTLGTKNRPARLATVARIVSRQMSNSLHVLRKALHLGEPAAKDFGLVGSTVYAGGKVLLHHRLDREGHGD